MNNKIITRDMLYLLDSGYSKEEANKLIKRWSKFNYRESQIKKSPTNKKDIEFIEYIMNKNQKNENKKQKLLINWIN